MPAFFNKRSGKVYPKVILYEQEHCKDTESWFGINIEYT